MSYFNFYSSKLRQLQGVENTQKILNIMYSNVDSLLNNRHELDLLLNSLDTKPQIIALTEVTYKIRILNMKFIPGYIIRHNIQNKGERGVVIYVSSDLECIFVESASHGPEFVVIKLEIEKGHYITLGNIYRSPNSTQTDDVNLLRN